MTQVLETMIERQRLEMHQKLNEMFKTYFDAKEMEITKAASEPEKHEEDDELYRLRQAAIRSSETKRTVENCSEPEKETTALENKEKKDNFSCPKFDTFDQFKKYKQKMRDEGRTDQSLIVSIPNISETIDVDEELSRFTGGDSES